jgi:hypothetical protein
LATKFTIIRQRVKRNKRTPTFKVKVILGGQALQGMTPSQTQANKMSLVNAHVTFWRRNIPWYRPYFVLVLYLSPFVVFEIVKYISVDTYIGVILFYFFNECIAACADLALMK